MEGAPEEDGNRYRRMLVKCVTRWMGDSARSRSRPLAVFGSGVLVADGGVGGVPPFWLLLLLGLLSRGVVFGVDVVCRWVVEDGRWRSEKCLGRLVIYHKVQSAMARGVGSGN